MKFILKPYGLFHRTPVRHHKFKQNFSATLLFIVADFYIKNNFFAKNVVIFRKNAVYIVKSSFFRKDSVANDGNL